MSQVLFPRIVVRYTALVPCVAGEKERKRKKNLIFGMERSQFLWFPRNV